jgi:hypothetical protein
MVAGAVPCASAGPAIRLIATTAALSVLSIVVILFSKRVAANPGWISADRQEPIVTIENVRQGLNPL